MAYTQDGMGTRVARTRPGGRTARVGRKVEQATVQLLAERGYDGWSYKEVAEAAGVNRSTLYRRWPNRSAMVLAAIRRAVLTHVVFEDTGSLMGDLRSALLKIGDFVGSGIGKNVMIAVLNMQQKGELTFDDGLSWTERAQDILPVFERATARGELPEKFDAEGAFAMLSGAMYFRVIVMRKTPDAIWAERILAQFSRKWLHPQ